MTAKGYTDATKIALLLDATLTANQLARLDSGPDGGLIEAAERWIDEYTGQSWLIGSPVTAERHMIEVGMVWLAQRPITEVTAVTLGGQFSTGTLLTETTDYLVDLTRGLITFRCLSGREVAIDYTLPQTVPADVAEAAALLASSWLQGAQASVGAAAGGLYSSIRIDDEQITYRDPNQRTSSSTGSEIPLTAESLLRHYCRPMVV